MNKTKGYAAQDDQNAFNKKEFGFNVLPPILMPGHFIIYKEVKPLKRDDVLVTSFIKAMNESKFYKEAQKNGYIKYLANCGIRFEWVHDESIGKRVRKVILDDQTYDSLSQWLLEIDYSDKKPFLYLTPAIQSPICFYNAELIQKRVPEILEWEKGNLISECEIEEGETEGKVFDA